MKPKFLVVCIVMILVAAVKESTALSLYNGTLGYKDILEHLLHGLSRSAGSTDYDNDNRLESDGKVGNMLSVSDNLYELLGPKIERIDAKEYLLPKTDRNKIFAELLKWSIRNHFHRSGVTLRDKKAKSELFKNDVFRAFGSGKGSNKLDNMKTQTLFLRGYRSNGPLGDAGYGSRIDAARNLAHDIDVMHKLFGSAGPGRRR